MKKNEYILKSFMRAGGVFAYVSALVSIAFLTQGMSKNFPDILAPVFMLTIFIISASVTGYLVLGKPIELYLGGAKREAVKMLFATIAWLALFLIVVAGVLILAQ